MFAKKIQVEAELYERIRAFSEKEGYSSLEEFVAHVMEKELAQKSDLDEDEEIKKRLHGLGYLG